MIKTYQLCVIGAYGQRKAIGPLMTLTQAERYQADMTLAGFNVLVTNAATDYDCSLATRGRKVWQRFTMMQV